MSKMKTFYSVLLSVMLMTSMAACSNGNSTGGGSSATDSPPVQQSSDNAAQPQQEEESKEPEYNLDGREIVISHWWDATPKAETEVGELALERQAAVEEKYNVKIKYVTTEYWDTAEKLSATVLANDPFADIVRLPDGFIWSMMEGGFLTQLDEAMADTRIAPQIVEAMRFGGDHIYSFNGWDYPNDSGVFYNKRIFEEAGLKNPQELMDEDNWNWTTFIDAAKKLTVDKNGDGKLDQYGLAGAHYVLSEFLIYSNDAVVFDEANRKVAFDSPHAMEALNTLYALYNEHKVVKENEGDAWEDPAKYFASGTIAMYPGGLWEIEGRLKNKIADEWGYVYFPKGPKATGFKDQITQTAAYVIPKGVKDADVVYKVWEDLQDFDNYLDDRRSSLENLLPDEASLANAMNDQGKIERVYGRFGGLGIKDHLDSVTEKFIKGEVTPATGVAQILQQAQASADKVFKGE